jgi:hypothetical protein
MAKAQKLPATTPAVAPPVPAAAPVKANPKPAAPAKARPVTTTVTYRHVDARTGKVEYTRENVPAIVTPAGCWRFAVRDIKTAARPGDRFTDSKGVERTIIKASLIEHNGQYQCQVKP